jgi:protein-tyrosine kinase
VSKFYQALERAERESAFQKQSRGTGQGSFRARRQREPMLSVASEKHREEYREDPARASANKFTRAAREEVDTRLIGLSASATFEAEQYRVLCYNIEKLHQQSGVSLVAISSPSVGDGKTTTAINVAGTMAQLFASNVLLIDVDLRRPSIAQQLGLDRSHLPGLTHVVADTALSLDDAVQQVPASNLHVLTVGNSSTTPHEILKSRRFREMLAEARRQFEYVILDTPPLIPFPDCQFLEENVDGFALVIAMHRTPRELIEKALHLVDPEKILGIIINNNDLPTPGYYSYYADNPPYQNRTRGERSLWPFSGIASLFRRSSR